VGYVGLTSRRYFSGHIADEPKPPFVVGTILTASSAAAVLGALHVLWQFAKYQAMLPEQRDATAAPQIPLDFGVLLVVALLWVSIETARQVLCGWGRNRKLSQSQRKQIFAEAETDIRQHLDEVKKAIAQKSGVTTAQLLQNVAAAIHHSER
jgi:hypothetical protein